MSAWAAEQFPRGDDESAAAHARAVRAKALDLVRGILPAASLSHMGIYASGQTYEQLVLHLLANPLAEAQAYGQMLLEELQKIIPSFVVRVPKPDRGGRWIQFLERTARRRPRAPRRGSASTTAEPAAAPSVRLVRAHGTETQLAAALLYEATATGEEEALRAVAMLSDGERAALLRELIGTRENRRHRPGRGFETLCYRFEIVSDYGAFRDLQRHRLLTCQWQRLSPDLGADVPHELVAAGLAGEYERALDVSRAAYERAPRRRLRRRGAVRALPRVPDPLRPRARRARGAAPDRAAFGGGGPSLVPRGCARDAPSDRGGAPERRRRDDVRRRLDGGAARAPPQRDAERIALGVNSLE